MLTSGNSVGRAYKVVVGEVCDVSGLNTKILEGLGLGVNDLVHELALDLVGRESVPPERIVKHTSNRLEESLGDVQVSALLEDFLINKFGDLPHGVLLRSIQFEGLSGSAVVVEHLLQCRADIDGLGRH